uniref:Uncharacterized protein n=1 Tax=Vespula pensylvanica TaxID=30213 RepID=A0A834P5E9_VESPE|nr:hypothetical protein H0235_005733 [Vespula pensylvanica]
MVCTPILGSSQVLQGFFVSAKTDRFGLQYQFLQDEYYKGEDELKMLIVGWFLFLLKCQKQARTLGIDVERILASKKSVWFLTTLSKLSPKTVSLMGPPKNFRYLR